MKVALNSQHGRAVHTSKVSNNFSIKCTHMRSDDKEKKRVTSGEGEKEKCSSFNSTRGKRL